MNKTLILLSVVLFSTFAQAVEMGVPIQLKLKAPDGSYPTEAGLTFTVQVIAPSGGCILREETFAGQTLTSGTISLALGSGTPGAKDASPAIALTDVYSNTGAKNGLTCVDASNNITGTGQSYNPAATDTRIIRVMTTLSGAVNILADFIQRSVPYAIQAESVGGKAGADILVQNGSTSLNQANLESLLANATKFNKLSNIATNGIADSATTATTAGSAVNFSANLSGDVTGTQSATVVTAIRGVTVSATAPTVGQVLTYNGSQYVAADPAAAGVNTVNGQSGNVVLTASDVGAITSSTAFAGDVTGNANATVVSSVGGKSAASVTATVNSVDAATAAPTASTIARRDGSGNLVAAGLVATGASLQNLLIYDSGNSNKVTINAPASFSDYTLVLPTSNGNPGESLQTDGNGNLSWAAGASVTSSSIATALGYTAADDAAVAKRANNLSDLASATVARTNLGLGGAALLNVGTGAGTVAAGNDSRIVGALQAASLNVTAPISSTGGSNPTLSMAQASGSADGYLASGDWTTFNNKVSATSASVIAALGYTPADNAASGNYALKASNLSDLASATVARSNLGLGGAAVLNIGTTAGTVAAGDDARITGALSGTSFSTYVASATCTAGQSMYWNSVSSTFLCQNIAVSGDISGIASSVTVTKLQGTGVSFASIANGHILQYNGTNIVNRAIPTCAGGEYLTFNGTAWSCVTDAGGGGTIASINVTAPISSTGGSTPTLSMAQANGSTDGYLASGDWTTFNNKVSATSAAVIAALGYTPANNAASGTYMVKASNLSDLASATVARSNLGLGGAAVLNVGTGAGTVAAGDDSRIVNALTASTVFGGDVSGTYNSIALVNSGVTAGTYAKVTVNAKGLVTSSSSLSSSDITTALGFTPANNAASGTYAQKANNLSDLTSATVARTNLGLGGAAVLNVGTGAGTVAAGDDSRIVNALTTSTVHGGDVSGTYNSLVLASVGAGVTSGTQYTKVTVDGKGRVTSGASLSSSDVTAALGFTPADNAASGTYMVKASNLSDLASATVARTNLGLGSLAIANFIDLGTSQASGTLAAARLPAFSGGDVSSSVGSAVLSLASVGAGVTSGTQYTKVTVDGKGRVTSGAQLSSSDVTTALGFTPADNAASGTYMVKASNLSDLASATVARTNLGLGGAAVLSVGTTAGTVAAGDDARITGALSGTSFSTYVASATCTAGQSMYWNSVSSTFLCQNITLSGDLSGIASAATVTKIQGVGASFSAIASGHILQYDGSNIINRAIPTCSANQYLTFNGTAWSCATDLAAAGIVSSVAVAAPLQTTGGNAPTLSMPQATGSVSGYLTGTDWTTFNNKIASSAAAIAQVLGFTPADSALVSLKANNLSDLTDVATARTNLGLGDFATASTVDLGSASATGTLAPARLPAFDGDVSSSVGSSTVTVTKIQGVPVSSGAPAAGQALIYDGVQWVPTTGMPQYSRVTAVYTNNSTTFTNVSGLSFPVVAGKTYKYRFNVIFSVSSSTRAMKLLLSTPSVTTVAAQVVIPTSTTAAGNYVIAAQSGTANGGTNGVAAQTLLSIVEGLIVPSANGVVQLQAGMVSAGATVTITPGSTVEFIEVP